MSKKSTNAPTPTPNPGAPPTDVFEAALLDDPAVTRTWWLSTAVTDDLLGDVDVQVVDSLVLLSADGDSVQIGNVATVEGITGILDLWDTSLPTPDGGGAVRVCKWPGCGRVLPKGASGSQRFCGATMPDVAGVERHVHSAATRKEAVRLAQQQASAADGAMPITDGHATIAEQMKEMAKIADRIGKAAAIVADAAHTVVDEGAYDTEVLLARGKADARVAEARADRALAMNEAASCRDEMAKALAARDMAVEDRAIAEQKMAAAIEAAVAAHAAAEETVMAAGARAVEAEERAQAAKDEASAAVRKSERTSARAEKRRGAALEAQRDAEAAAAAAERVATQAQHRAEVAEARMRDAEERAAAAIEAAHQADMDKRVAEERLATRSELAEAQVAEAEARAVAAEAKADAAADALESVHREVDDLRERVAEQSAALERLGGGRR